MHDINKQKQTLFNKILDYTVGILISFLPHLPLFNSIKSLLMRARGATIGQRVQLLSGLWIDNYKKLTIGEDVSLAKDIIMVASGGIIIGNRSMIGYRTTILTANHIVPFDRGKMRFSGLEFKEVVIENDVWIGAHVVILPGVRIGEGAIVGAGSIVTKNIAPFCIVAGVPAQVIRERD